MLTNQMVSNPHELAADDVLSVVLNEKDAWLTLEEYGLKPAHMPTPEHRAALAAVVELRRCNAAVHDTTVMDKTAGVVKLDWISKRFALYDLTRNGDVFRDNVKLVLKYGFNLGVQRVLNTAIAQLKEAKKPTDLLVNQVIEILSTVQSDTSISGETARAAAADFRQFMNSEPPPILSTGLQFLDDITSGFEKQMIWWIAGAYKGRKTTLMFLLAMAALLQDASVTILSREMPRRRVAANMIAMLATAYLLRKGWYALEDGNIKPLNNLSSMSLMHARAGYRKWDSRKVEAVDFGIARWEAFENKLRIYDTSTTGGALNDWISVERVIKRDQAKYGNPDIVFADYLQLFGAPSDKTYEKVSYLSTKFQALAQRENLTAVVLAQRNEASITSGKGSYSPGVKGGGDAAQTADYMLLTTYKQDDTDATKLNIQMKLSRHGVGGNDIEQDFIIHPPSGLILDCKWISQLKV